MTTLETRRPCAKCSTGRGIATCNGCQQMFCINHFTEHREELSNIMDNISLEHDLLCGDLCQENLEHPFLSRLDTWEQESILKIQTAAQTARTKLQQIFTQKRDEVKTSVEYLTNELQASRESADYTENDIQKWTEKLKTLREKLNDWSTVTIEDDDHLESIIHLLKISDQQNQPTLSIVQSFEYCAHVPEQSTLPDEKFDNIESEVILSENNLVATCRSIINIFSNPFIYGTNRYSSGKSSIHFSIEKKGETPLFLGIITALKKYDQSFFSPDNSSVYGWYNIESFVISGKSQKYKPERALVAGDELTLILDCDEPQILLQHQKTKQLFQIPVRLEKCPFPWKLLVGLSNFNDSIRIIN
jgi:hypothetical protein